MLFSNKYPLLDRRLSGLYYCENKDTYYDIESNYSSFSGPKWELNIDECDKKGEKLDQVPYAHIKGGVSIQEWYIDRHKSIIGDKEYKERFTGFRKSFLVKSYPAFDPRYDFLLFTLFNDMAIFTDGEPRESTARELFFLKRLQYRHMGCTEQEMKEGSKSISKNNENNERYEQHGESWLHIIKDKVRILPKLISEHKISYETLEPLLGKEFEDLLWLKKLG